ncbi:hypothetical protein ACSYAY_09430 [Leptospirillum ferriphilum]|uniref:Uncharacterized protein n=2 Tax=Leptospirillum TaxID=179 RepID=A0A094X3V9_9BACT|nr:MULTISPECIES: hypothetical protein [Leptospirillum]EAY56856.1 MAG: hypothetical protein UBAL2_80490133 [Leptospirillum rubarum]EDZ38131.1 MAG: Hypothetical protein CGL2_11390070 [Leptospirillum sp. Group II '5-way CG']EIJ76778.1 MAG: Hypothetical protein C75L2_00380143 [Leptospirillum sp. Group II 'C75']AKS23950.1 hypothetical protein ABH19_09715 [Leptospirillum sp. Group II 'CF-1']KGA93259.1 hypothetical protein LptCag_0295 [Leptospirillum ferriphilum]
MSRDFFCLFRRRLEAGIGVLLVVLCFCGNALADSSDIFELSAGEMVFSQRAQFYDVEVGGLIPLPVLSSGSQPAYVHFFAAGSVINFDQPATGSTPGINGITDQSYTGVIPAVGLRIPATWGYWEGDVGGAFFNVDQTLTPVTSIADVYLQTELFLNQAGPGSLDLFGSYIGGINYLFGMGRYMLEAGHTSGRKVLFFAGPEVIAQGNDTYAALQGGGVLSADVVPIHTIFTLEAGLLNSTVWPGVGGYEGFSFYYSY